MQKLIPMTKATGLGPMPIMLDQYASGKALTRVFQQENVPLDILEHRETRMPLASMMGLFEHAARETGSRTFGLSVGKAMNHSSFGLWLVYSASAPTLGDALSRSGIVARFQQSGSKLVVEQKGKYSAWRYIAPRVFENPIQHCRSFTGTNDEVCARVFGRTVATGVD
jgi:hypothetical protein